MFFNLSDNKLFIDFNDGDVTGVGGDEFDCKLTTLSLVNWGELGDEYDFLSLKSPFDRNCLGELKSDEDSGCCCCCEGGNGDGVLASSTNLGEDFGILKLRKSSADFAVLK